VDQRKSSCPICRSNLIIPPEPAKHLNALVHEWEFGCEFEGLGCKHKCKLADMSAHKRECVYVTVECPYAAYGCDHKCTRASMPTHLEKAMGEHDELKLKMHQEVLTKLEAATAVRSANHNVLTDQITTGFSAVGPLASRLGALENKVDLLLTKTEAMASVAETARRRCAAPGEGTSKSALHRYKQREEEMERLKAENADMAKQLAQLQAQVPGASGSGAGGQVPTVLTVPAAPNAPAAPTASPSLASNANGKRSRRMVDADSEDESDDLGPLIGF
jgi:hypothetical protein